MFGRKRGVLATTRELGREMERFTADCPLQTESTLGLVTGMGAALRSHAPKLTQRFQEAAEALRGGTEVEQRAVRMAVVSTGTLGSLVSFAKSLTPLIMLGPEFDPKVYEVACALKDSVSEYLQACEG